MGWLPSPRYSGTAILRDGREMRCELSDRTQRTMYLGLFEPGETRLLRELLAPGDTFVDVGAHIGWFTTLAARQVGTAGQVVAIEPYAANAVALRYNLTRNNCRNVTVLEVAVGSGRGMLKLAHGADSGAVTAVDWTGAQRVEVPVITLDDATAGLGVITLLKIDVEGWEAHVLRGGQMALARTGRVLIEINPEALRKAGSSPEEILGLLTDAGFSTFRKVSSGGLRRLHRTSVFNLYATRPEHSGTGQGLWDGGWTIIALSFPSGRLPASPARRQWSHNTCRLRCCLAASSQEPPR